MTRLLLLQPLPCLQPCWALSCTQPAPLFSLPLHCACPVPSPSCLLQECALRSPSLIRLRWTPHTDLSGSCPSVVPLFRYSRVTSQYNVRFALFSFSPFSLPAQQLWAVLLFVLYLQHLEQRLVLSRHPRNIVRWMKNQRNRIARSLSPCQWSLGDTSSF